MRNSMRRGGGMCRGGDLGLAVAGLVGGGCFGVGVGGEELAGGSLGEGGEGGFVGEDCGLRDAL